MEADVDMRDSISPGKCGQPDTHPPMTARKGPAAALPRIIPKPRTSTLRPRSCSDVRKGGVFSPTRPRYLVSSTTPPSGNTSLRGRLDP
ncbi:hypothetical protein E2C01_091519 [Portunus trituberculatus]|uniref:Uncharacterized protein n=1 Tax=Portunus trituberculatus TaxID=210409 RepID=A0A5B7JHQ4_PORTR|nr:hypothetical protein [Portunus trituberculatus]